MLKRLIILSVFLFCFTSVTIFAQTDAVALKDSTGTLIASYSSIAAAYAAVPSPVLHSCFIEILPAYDCSAETFPIALGLKASTSSSVRITIRPAAGNTGELISSTVTGPIINLDDADFVTIDGRPGGIGTAPDLKIQNLATGSSGHTIRLINGACNNVIQYCNLLNGTVNTAGPRTIEFSTSVSNTSGNSFNTVSHCIFNGGRSGIGLAGTAANPNSDIKIDNCEIFNFGYAGVWLLSGFKNITVEKCSIYQTQGISTTLIFGFNIGSSTGAGKITIQKNKIYNIQATSTSTSLYIRGIYVTTSAGTVLDINNNFISLPLDNQSGSIYGIHLTGSADYTANINYNTIRVAGNHTGGTSGNVVSAAIYKVNTGANSVLTMKNNILINERTGGTSGVKHPAFGIDPSTTALTVDYNDYYTTSTGPAHVVWAGTGYTDIAAYRAAVSPQEQHSKFHAVNFTSITDLHLTGSSIGDNELAGTPLVEFPTDIDDQTRSASVPYMGADEGNVPLSGGPLFTWQSNITFADNGGMNQALGFGMAPNATDGLDTALGEVEIPVVPPSGVFYSWFELPIPTAIHTYKDYRCDTAKAATWLIKFQPGAGGYPFTITWNPATLPAGNFWLRDVLTGNLININMRTQNNYTLTETQYTSLKIVYSKQMSLTIPLAPGWNMVAVPFLADDMTGSVLFPGSTSSIFGYSNGYVAQTTLTNGKGYWVRYANNTNVTLTGNAISSNSIPLESGWNMIGVYQNPVTVANITTTPSGIINSNFFGYSNGYTMPTILDPGKGFWVRTTQAGTMNFGAFENTSAMKNELPAKIIFTDAAGRSTALYSGTNAGSFASLPPVPPQSSSIGGFDVRFETQNYIEDLSAPKAISISGAQYPIRMQTNGIGLRVRDRATNGKLVNEIIPANGALLISNPSVAVIEVQMTETPLSYELMQNYPNPFNPTTTINYQIPVNGLVTLKVYDAIGTEVATLVNSHQESGSYNVTFDASKLNSGVYFYTLRSGDFSATKKLIILK